MKLKDKPYTNVLIAGLLTALLMVSLSFLHKILGGISGTGSTHRLVTLFGGNFFNGGYIQGLTFFSFIWAILEIYSQTKSLFKENQAFKLKLLPTNEKHLLMAEDLKSLQQKISEIEKRKNRTLISSLIKNVCLKFRSTKSIPEILEIISIQTDINRDKAESDQSLIRYLTWTIPSIGFIGTVLGISKALSIAGSGDMKLITDTLGVAFDTTLVSLVLSIIVMYFFHYLQEKTDKLHANIKEYIIENLVNKIEV
ncbi:MAG: MotA/TolQ/ExbB proton channel family protein [Bacteriovoracaceae bacterium]